MRTLSRCLIATLPLTLSLGCKDDTPADDTVDSQPQIIDVDGDGFVEDEDCDDNDPAIRPDADEICDGVDNDCDGAVDHEDDSLTDALGVYYADADADGYGDPAVSIERCEQPDGHVDNDLDCDDSVAEVSPDGVEVCDDGVDNDCDGLETACVTELEQSDALLTGEAPGYRSGIFVAGLPDIDGDGRNDIAIGASQESSFASANDGAAYLYFGVPGSGSLAEADLIVRGQNDSEVGRSLAAADFDGDGVVDLLLSADKDPTRALRAGAVFLYPGPLTPGELGTDDAAVAIFGEAGGDRFGVAVASAGDFTGDAQADLVVGATSHDEGATNNGAVYLMAGPLVSGQTVNDAQVTLLGAATADQLGSRAEGVGDLNGDGLAEVLVASRIHDDARGAVYVLPGGSSGTINADDLSDRLDGGDPGDSAGSAIARAGDVNGDGFPDIVVGAIRAGEGGEAYLVPGPVIGIASLADAAWVTFTSEAASDQLGAAVDSAQASEGRAILVTANRAGDNDAGASFLFRDPAAGTLSAADADLVHRGVGEGDYLGSWAAFVGDVAGNGADSLLLGSSSSDAGGEEAGAAYLLLDVGL